MLTDMFDDGMEVQEGGVSTAVYSSYFKCISFFNMFFSEAKKLRW